MSIVYKFCFYLRVACTGWTSSCCWCALSALSEHIFQFIVLRKETTMLHDATQSSQSMDNCYWSTLLSQIKIFIWTKLVSIWSSEPFSLVCRNQPLNFRLALHSLLIHHCIFDYICSGTSRFSCGYHASYLQKVLQWSSSIGHTGTVRENYPKPSFLHCLPCKPKFFSSSHYCRLPKERVL